MATPDERKVLKIIEEKGEESHEVTIANEMGLRLDYVRTILSSMGARDYIDVLRSGKVKIADKGWTVLGKSSPTRYGTDSIPDETPEERFKRYMSRGVKEESSGTPEQRSSETMEETSKNLDKKTQKASAESYRKTIEELAEEDSLMPEEKFKRYMSR